jgi:hypothetical protein
VLGPVLWKYQSTGRCTDAGASNFLDKSNEQSSERDEVEACSGVGEVLDDAGSCSMTRRDVLWGA